jgi:hypothetical protein
MARSTGLGAASLELLRPTAPPAEPLDGPSAPDELEAGDPEGRGDQAPEARPTATRTRRRRPAPTGKAKARNLHLTDDVHDRLWLLARQRKTTVSAVANDLLDKALPRWRMEREG